MQGSPDLDVFRSERKSRPGVAGVPVLVERSRAYYPALDGMRGVAFLLVFLFHYLTFPWGWTGVEMFFVLSGFLITGILYDTRDDPHKVRNFYIRRTLRIFPLYYATLAVVFCLALLLHLQVNGYALAWPFYLGNLLGLLHPAGVDSALGRMASGDLWSASSPLGLDIGHFWSLCVEEQFYLCWPAIVFFVRGRRALIALCAALILLCPWGRLLAQSRAPAWMLSAELLYRFTPLRMDAFAYGGLLALLRRGERSAWLERFAKWYLVAAVIGLAVFLGPHVPRALRYHVFQYPRWEFTWGLVLADTFSLCLLIVALQPYSVVSRMFTWSWLRWVGGISYGAYVFHFIPFEFARLDLLHLPMEHKKLPSAAVILTLTLVLAWASFRYFETPLIRLKARWAE